MLRETFRAKTSLWSFLVSYVFSDFEENFRTSGVKNSAKLAELRPPCPFESSDELFFSRMFFCSDISGIWLTKIGLQENSFQQCCLWSFLRAQKYLLTRNDFFLKTSFIHKLYLDFERLFLDIGRKVFDKFIEIAFCLLRGLFCRKVFFSGIKVD